MSKQIKESIETTNGIFKNVNIREILLSLGFETCNLLEVKADKEFETSQLPPYEFAGIDLVALAEI